LGEALVAVGFWVKFWMNRRLAKVLRERPGWQPEELAGERFWCLGVDSAARLIIVPRIYGFLMYRADKNLSWVLHRIKSVDDWLTENEPTLAGPTPQVNCEEALKQARNRRKRKGRLVVT
jgi:hypothetical protein